jgi:hypothetical protein
MNRLRCFPLAVAVVVPVALATPPALAQPFPAFTNPTNITNPFYPVSNTKHSITLGVDDGDAYRSEVVLLPTTRTIAWAGGVTQARVSQYSAYRNGDLIEVAYDFFAQADNGDLYYFGEDVFNYEDGVVVDNHGTWLAGQDGAPPGLIMPANPVVGQVFYPENFAPLVWEEATVVSLNEPSRTPLGPINNGLLIHELFLDGNTEFKVYAAGWGQVEVREANAALHLALLNRSTAPTRQVPWALDAIESRAEDVLDAVPNWRRVRAYALGASRAWNVYRPQAIAAGAPPEFIEEMGQQVANLTAASQAQSVIATQEAAIELRDVAIDLFTFYNPRVPADVKRIAHLGREVMLDVRGGDWTQVAILNAKAHDAIWARLRPFVLLRHCGAARAAAVDEAFADLAEAIDDEDVHDALEAARDVIEAIEEVEDRY